MDTAELESFLNEKSAKENDIVEIVGEGNIEVKEDPVSHRKYKVLNIPVKCNNRELTYTPDKDAVNVLQSIYGMNTSSWIGKKFSVKFVMKSAFGKVRKSIFPEPLEPKKK
jgi:hypothetical protein